MELQETPTPTPRKSALPYMIGVGVIVLLAAAAFMAVRYFVQPKNPFRQWTRWKCHLRARSRR